MAKKPHQHLTSKEAGSLARDLVAGKKEVTPHDLVVTCSECRHLIEHALAKKSPPLTETVMGELMSRIWNPFVTLGHELFIKEQTEWLEYPSNFRIIKNRTELVRRQLIARQRIKKALEFTKGINREYWKMHNIKRATETSPFIPHGSIEEMRVNETAIHSFIDVLLGRTQLIGDEIDLTPFKEIASRIDKV